MSKKDNNVINFQDRVENKDKIHIQLSLLEKQKDASSDLSLEIMQDELDNINPVRKNEVKFNTLYAFANEDGVEVSVIITNGFDNVVSFGKVPLKIVDLQDNILAYEVFDLEELGEIPSFGARPWKLNFKKENVYVVDFPKSDWKLYFDMKLRPDLVTNMEFEELSTDLDHAYINDVNRFLRGLSKLTLGTVRIDIFKMVKQDNGDLMLTTVIRNSNPEPVRIDTIPFSMFDENNNKVTRSVYNDLNLIISAYKAKLLNFIIPNYLIAGEITDIEKYIVKFE